MSDCTSVLPRCRTASSRPSAAYLRYKSPHVTGTELRVVATASSVLERKNDQLRSGRGSSACEFEKCCTKGMRRPHGRRQTHRHDLNASRRPETCQSQDQVQECVGAGALADWKAIGGRSGGDITILRIARALCEPEWFDDICDLHCNTPRATLTTESAAAEALGRRILNDEGR